MIVEDGLGLEAADSYTTVSDADDYIGLDARWTNLSNAEKEKALIDATRYIDAQYGPLFTGVKLTKNQALEWPRNGAYDGSFPVYPDEIPNRLKRAVAQLALEAIGKELLPAVDETVTELSVGVISQKIIPGPPKYPFVKKILTPLLDIASIRVSR